MKWSAGWAAAPESGGSPRAFRARPRDRAEAIRWALTRIRERPAYEELREHTRDIERLKNEF